MASTALVEWRAERAARIQDLLDAHNHVGTSGQRRRWRSTQLNWAIVLRIAAEFQGYARSLHDVAVDEIATRTAELNPALEAVLRRITTNGRMLDRANPGPDALAADFSRTGMDLWTEMGRRYPSWTPRAQERLQSLLNARNGIAHSDYLKMANVETAGDTLSRLSTIRSWYASTNRLAAMMDTTVSGYLARTLGGDVPW